MVTIGGICLVCGIAAIFAAIRQKAADALSEARAQQAKIKATLGIVSNSPMVITLGVRRSMSSIDVRHLLENLEFDVIGPSSEQPTGRLVLRAERHYGRSIGGSWPLDEIYRFYFTSEGTPDSVEWSEVSVGGQAIRHTAPIAE